MSVHGTYLMSKSIVSLISLFPYSPLSTFSRCKRRLHSLLILFTLLYNRGSLLPLWRSIFASKLFPGCLSSSLFIFLSLYLSVAFFSTLIASLRMLFEFDILTRRLHFLHRWIKTHSFLWIVRLFELRISIQYILLKMFPWIFWQYIFFG